MKHSVKISLLALVALFAFNTVAEAQFGLLGGMAGALSNKKKKGKEVALANGEKIKTTLTPIGKTEVLSWEDMEDEAAQAGIFKAMQKKQNKYNNDTDSRLKVGDESKGEIVKIGITSETWTYSRDNWGDIKSRSLPFFIILKNKLGYYVTNKFWATQAYNGSTYDAFTIDPIMSGTAEANTYRRVIIDWLDEDTAKYQMKVE